MTSASALDRRFSKPDLPLASFSLANLDILALKGANEMPGAGESLGESTRFLSAWKASSAFRFREISCREEPTAGDKDVEVRFPTAFSDWLGKDNPRPDSIPAAGGEDVLTRLGASCCPKFRGNCLAGPELDPRNGNCLKRCS
jgi:hypothetical protein